MITYQVKIRERDQRYKTLWYNAQPPDSEDSVAHTVKLMEELFKPQKQIKNKDMSFRESNSL